MSDDYGLWNHNAEMDRDDDVPTDEILEQSDCPPTDPGDPLDDEDESCQISGLCHPSINPATVALHGVCTRCNPYCAAREVPWLMIGGDKFLPGEIPWFWQARECRAHIAEWYWSGQPFIVGPNVLFSDSRKPCQYPWEKTILCAQGCRLLFTESAWYRDLIAAHMSHPCAAKICVCPYPVGEEPEGPLPAEFDLLIYLKSGADESLVYALQQAYPRNATVRYGKYERSEMIRAARQSQCCAYISDDDRQPIALAEILMAGCPAVGVPKGAPSVLDGATGYHIEKLTPIWFMNGIKKASELNRESVRAAAKVFFDPVMITDTIIGALERVREA